MTRLVVCPLPTAMICEVGNHRLVDGIVPPVESQLQKSLVELINHRIKLRELLFIKLLFATMMKILKNTLFKCGIESDIAFTKVSGDV